MEFKYLLISVFLLICLWSCKKNVVVPVPPVTIIGKWQLVKQYSLLVNNGVVIDSIKKSKFTNNDFVQYLSDGTGYYSKSTPTGPSLSEFTYTISGTHITEFVSFENKGVPETVTSLTANSLSVHRELLVPDPNDPTVYDTEKDDLSYIK
ncbi:hypothetical protein [Mucilaginibacter sp.]|uniref:hypothetical protein n=1 Tax=Mucilaginibacter sp. TaxID=1882438 RepID=UPI00285274C0|nr:hypothetical protein [Mucilaginibacter sp.]